MNLSMIAICLISTSSGYVAFRKPMDSSIEIVDYRCTPSGSFVAYVHVSDQPTASGLYHYNSKKHTFKRMSGIQLLHASNPFDTPYVGINIAPNGNGDNVSIVNLDTDAEMILDLPQKYVSIAQYGEWILTRPSYDLQYDAHNFVNERKVSLSSFDFVDFTEDKIWTVGRAQQPGPGYFLLEQRDRSTLRLLRSERFGDTEMEYSALIGTCANPPFVIQRSYVGVGVESFKYDIFYNDIKWQGVSFESLFDCGDWGVLFGGRKGYPDPHSVPSYIAYIGPLETVHKWKVPLPSYPQGVRKDGSLVQVALDNSIWTLQLETGKVIRKQRFSKERVWEDEALSQRKSLWMVRVDGSRSVIELVRS